jgi:hypothetical protein
MTNLLKSKKLVLQLVLLTWLIQVLVCYRLWFQDSDTFVFHITGFDGLETLRKTIAVVVMALLLVSMVFPGRYTLPALIFAWLVLTPFNLNVWQAWFWLSYLLVLTAYLAPALFHQSIWVFLAGMYWWSGLYKLNAFYAPDWEWNLQEHPSAGGLLSVMKLVPYGEIGLGTMLWIAPLRRYLHLVAAGFHLGIALVLSPLVLDMNHVVIPWNMCLMALNLLLFVSPPPALAKRQRWQSLLPGFVCSWFFPALTLLFGTWHAQAFNLYSGHMNYVEIQVDGTVSSIFAMHVEHTGVPCLPDETAQMDTFDKLCAAGEITGGWITERSWKTETVTAISCPPLP